MNVIQQAILKLQKEIDQSNDRLSYLTGSELTRENYHCGRLHLDLRKIITIANQNASGFWCSVCGNQYPTPDLRNKHAYQEHVTNDI